ncbi:MAG: hypothetical protein HKN87_05950, partial [Saprospiraceae bacterium]|nr:hypothetical protein [Saprospiraceae bacterium]
MYIRIFSCLATIILCCATTLSAQNDVDSLLASFPANNTQDLERLAGEIVELGPSAIVSLAKKIRPNGAGRDADVLYALSALAKGPEKYRPQVEAGLIQALGEDIALEAQVFLIEQLQFIASDASLDVLSSKIRTLCEPALQAIGAIQSPKSLGTLLDAVDQVNGYCKQLLAKTLSQYQGPEVEQVLLDLANDKNALYAAEALLGMARSGSEKAKPLIVDYGSEDPAEGNNLLMILAQAQAASGNTSSAIETVHQVLSANPSSANQTAAYQLIVEHGSEDQLDELLKTCKKGDPQMQSVLTSAMVNAPAKYLPELFKLFDRLDASAQMNLLRAAHKHQYTAAIPLAQDLIGSTDPSLARVALSTYSTLAGKAGLPTLRKILLDSSKPSLMMAARHEASQWIDSSNLNFLEETLGQSGGAAKVNLFKLIGERGLASFWDQIKENLTADNPEVRKAAFATLPAIAHGVPVRHLTTVSPLINDASERTQLR